MIWYMRAGLKADLRPSGHQGMEERWNWVSVWEDHTELEEVTSEAWLLKFPSTYGMWGGKGVAMGSKK